MRLWPLWAIRAKISGRIFLSIFLKMYFYVIYILCIFILSFFKMYFHVIIYFIYRLQSFGCGRASFHQRHHTDHFRIGDDSGQCFVYINVTNKKKACDLPIFRYLLDSLTGLCYEQAWYARLGGCTALQYILENFPRSLAVNNAALILSAYFEVIIGLADEVTYNMALYR